MRLPTAMPFLFNRLKIEATLALIGTIVAENFGPPTLGMRFRISTAVGAACLAASLGRDCRGGAGGVGLLRSGGDGRVGGDLLASEPKIANRAIP
jgi:hypothetical protein